jgi:hypothetical protein
MPSGLSRCETPGRGQRAFPLAWCLNGKGANLDSPLSALRFQAQVFRRGAGVRFHNCLKYDTFHDTFSSDTACVSKIQGRR